MVYKEVTWKTKNIQYDTCSRIFTAIAYDWYYKKTIFPDPRNIPWRNQPSFEYFDNTNVCRFRRNGYLTVVTFPIEMWNMFQRIEQEIPRTNNHTVEWHNKFQTICAKYQIKFWKFWKPFFKNTMFNICLLLLTDDVSN